MSLAFLPSKTVSSPPAEAAGHTLRPSAGVGGYELADGIARGLDLAIILGSGLLANLLSGGSLGTSPAMTMALALALLLAANVLPLFKLYDLRRLNSLTYQLPRMAGAWCTVIAGVVVGTFMLATSGEIPRLWITYWFLLGGASLTVVRVGMRAWIERAQRVGEFTRNVLVIGSGTATPLVTGNDGAASPEGQMQATRIVGRIDIAHLADAQKPDQLSPEGMRILGQWLLSRRIDHVALTLAPDQLMVLTSLLGSLRHYPVEVGLVPQLPTAGVPVLGIKQVGAMPSVLLLEKPLEGWRYIVKEIEDRVLAAVILLFIAPLMLAIAAAVKFGSPGPVFFKQKRLGFNQQVVDVFKFRSMYVNACDAPMSDKVVQATKDDPRVTRVGRFLRKTSLDELPQLINVLRGEMSLVGPRPHAIAHDRYYAELIDGYLGRHRMKPGITGWAQVNGYRGETRTIEEMRRRIEFDLHYIDNWSLALDLRIIFRTLFVAFSDSKAY